MTSHKRGKSSNTSVALLTLDRMLGTTSANIEPIVFWYFDNFVWNWETSKVINVIEKIHTLFNALNLACKSNEWWIINYSSLGKLQSEEFNLVENTKRTIINKLNRMKTYILMPISCNLHMVDFKKICILSPLSAGPGKQRRRWLTSLI